MERTKGVRPAAGFNGRPNTMLYVLQFTAKGDGAYKKRWL